MWGDKPEHKVLALRERLNTLSRAEREALCQELMRPNVANSIEVLAPTSGKELLDLLVQTPGAGDVLGELIGGRCGGSCRTDLNLGCYNHSPDRRRRHPPRYSHHPFSASRFLRSRFFFAPRPGRRA